MFRYSISIPVEPNANTFIQMRCSISTMLYTAIYVQENLLGLAQAHPLPLKHTKPFLSANKIIIITILSLGRKRMRYRMRIRGNDNIAIMMLFIIRLKRASFKLKGQRFTSNSHVIFIAAQLYHLQDNPQEIIK